VFQDDARRYVTLQRQSGRTISGASLGVRVAGTRAIRLQACPESFASGIDTSPDYSRAMRHPAVVAAAAAAAAAAELEPANCIRGFIQSSVHAPTLLLWS